VAVISLPAVIQNLPDALLGDTKDLSQRRCGLTLLVSCANFSIAFAFGGCAVVDRELREFQAAIRDSHRERHGEQHLGE
jgi:hypothetical protein